MPETTERTGGDVVREMYETKQKLNELFKEAAEVHGFTIQWEIYPLSAINSKPYPRLEITVLTEVEY